VIGGTVVSTLHAPCGFQCKRWDGSSCLHSLLVALVLVVDVCIATSGSVVLRLSSVTLMK
jgi:hypothetical protein